MFLENSHTILLIHIKLAGGKILNLFRYVAAKLPFCAHAIGYTDPAVAPHKSPYYKSCN